MSQGTYSPGYSASPAHGRWGSKLCKTTRMSLTVHGSSSISLPLQAVGADASGTRVNPTNEHKEKSNNKFITSLMVLSGKYRHQPEWYSLQSSKTQENPHLFTICLEKLNKRSCNVAILSINSMVPTRRHKENNSKLLP